jgi:hypothetical protein
MIEVRVALRALLLQTDGPNFIAAIERITEGIRPIATPFAILGITFALLLALGAPIFPDMAQQNKGYVMRALGIIIFLALIPELVRWVATLGTAA